MRGSLKRIELFRELPAGVLLNLASAVQTHRFRKGEVLFEEGRPALTVWLIQRGWVHLLKRTPVGTQATIFTVTPEELLCGVSSVVGKEVYYASAVAATETVAIGVPQAHFAKLLTQQPGFAGRVLAIYHTRMRHMAQAMSLAQAPVEQRLAHVLLRLRGAFGRTIPITHHELARMASTRWETSIRTLSAMRQRGWVSTSRGRVTILHPKELQHLLAQPDHGISTSEPVNVNGRP